ncbi:MAG: hypothetical protein IJC43_04615 [Clostridia bacterium]|nr:hypothetical protein [Clostridia bacterium]
MFTRRLFFLFLFLLALFVPVTVRLYLLAAAPAEEYAAAAQRQQRMELTLSRRGGLITDCHGVPLNYAEGFFAALVQPAALTDPRHTAMLLANACSLTTARIEQAIGEGEPFGLVLSRPVEAAGVTLTPCLSRRVTPPAVHLLGTMGGDGQTPLSGVELGCQELLQQLGGRLYSAFQKTAGGNLLAGGSQLVDEGYREPSGLMLTLDASLQEILEEATTSLPAGAAVLLRMDGTIAASVSRPAYAGDAVGELLDSTGGELLNRALLPYNIGSVFKLLVAAQTLERGADTPVYHCAGGLEVDGLWMSCHYEAGHGALTLEQALAKSCNVYFIRLLLEQGAEGYEATLELARRLGYDSGERLCAGVQEAAGTLPKEAVSRRLLANTAIGQGALLATPLDLARTVAVFAGDGTLTAAPLVAGVLRDGERLGALTGPPAVQRIVSVETAAALRRMMVDTCLTGTGTSAVPANGSAGGKTASAETGWVRDGQPVVHGSFAGFFPAEQPRYVLVVLCEDGRSGSLSAAPVFREVAERVLAWEEEA